MSIPTFTPGFPPDGSSLGGTKAVIRNNLDGTFDTLGIDHIDNNGDPGGNPPGYHTVVHQVTQASVNTVAGVNQVFSGVPGTLSVNSVTTPFIPDNGDTQLYALTAGSGLSQLTGNFIATKGYNWMGGILIQWGKEIVTIDPDDVTILPSVSYEKSFPNNVLSFSATAFAPLTSRDPVSLTIVNIGLNGFRLMASTRAQTVGTYANYFWMAIGN